MAAPALLGILEDARMLGFVGPGPVESHIRHAEGFGAATGSVPRRVVDLGSGAGIPGLVLALVWPNALIDLLESNRRRVTFLREAVKRLGLEGRAAVLAGRAEDVGRDPLHRGGADLVVSRSFGPPAVVAECAAPLLEVGGRLVVSEPPRTEEQRWPAEGLSLVGLRRVEVVEGASGRFQVLEQAAGCPIRYPRRVGVPSKRPLFGP